MGGNNEVTINGLRFHENAGDVHVHMGDMKFVSPIKTFGAEYCDAVKVLSATDGVVEIKGTTPVSLFYYKRGKTSGAFLGGPGTVGPQILDFLKKSGA